MQKGQKLFHTIVFIIGSTIYLLLFLLIFTKVFDKRMPLLPEFLPLAALVLVSVFLLLKDSD